MSLRCSNDDDYIEEQTEVVNLRLTNGSNLNYEHILVYDYDYGNLNSGEFSEYKIVEEAYRYANVKLVVDGTQYMFQHYDYVGEESLENGHYTYVLSIVDRNVHIALVSD